MLTALALVVGFLGVAVMGAAHNVALLSIGRIAPRPARSHARIFVAFLGLLVLHLAEILAFSGLNAVLLDWPAFAGTDPIRLTWGDIVYLTGVNFTTLGYTQIELSGPVRLVVMAQALGGFMFLTWSATYLYSICERSWKRTEQE